MKILVFDSHLFHGVWSEQSLYFGYDRSLKPQENNRIVFLYATIYKKDIDGGAIALNHLDLHDSTSKGVFFNFNPFFDAIHGQRVAHDDRQQIRNALSGNSGGGDQADVFFRVFVFPVKSSVIPFCIQLQNDLF